MLDFILQFIVKRLLLTGLTFCLFFTSTVAQSPPNSWKEFLYDRDTRHVAFQGNDTLWVGTTSGGVYCIKTDGTYCYNFTRVNDNLPANTINDLAVDPVTHEVWIVTGHGIAKFNGSSWIKYNMSNTPQLNTDIFTSIIIDAKGVKWFGSYEEGLYGFNGTNWINYPDPENSSFPSWINSVVASAADGSIWMGVMGAGVFRLNYNDFNNLDDDEWTQYTTADGIKTPFAFVKASQRNGDVWVWSIGETMEGHNLGVNKFNYTTSTWSEISTVTITGFPSDGVNSIVIDQSDNAWFLSDAGLTKLTPSNVCQTFNADPDGNIRMPIDFGNSYNSNTKNLAIHPITQDVWLGTTEGVYKFANEKFFHKPTKGLPDIPIRDILITQSSNEKFVWVATEKGLYYKKTDNANEWEKLPLSILPSDNVTALAVNKNNLWIGTSLDGLYKYKLDGSAIPEKSNIGDNITSIAVDPANNNIVWVGTPSGLRRMNFQNNTSILYVNELTDPYVTSLDIKNDGNLWIGTLNGVTKYITGSGAWVHYSMLNIGLPYNNISAVSSDGNNGVWVGVYGHNEDFNAASFNGTTWQTYIRSNSIYDDRIKDVVYHANGPMFMTQNGGMIFFKNFTTWQQYTAENGLADNNGHAVALDVSDDEFTTNKVWFGTEYGVSSLENLLILPVRLIDFTAQAQHNKTVLLNWKTAAESNFSHYEVWRTFENNTIKIGTIPGSANSQYTLTDYYPGLGTNIYQLYMVDQDGATTKSPLRPVHIGLVGAAIRITPNPVTAGYMQIAFDKINAKQKVNIRIIDAAAKTVMHQQHELNQGTNTVTVNTGQLASGMYFIEIFMANGDAHEEKILVQ